MIERYVQAVRLREGHLSAQSVLGATCKPMSDFHQMHHELALARQATLSEGRREARAKAWMQSQQACFDLRKDTDGQNDNWHLRKILRLQTDRGAGPQVVLLPHSSSEDLCMLSYIFIQIHSLA